MAGSIYKSCRAGIVEVKEIIMIPFEKLNMVLFDFDNTLCIHEKYNKSGSSDQYNADVIAGKDCWKTGRPNIHIKKFIQLCQDNKIVTGLMSATMSFKHMEGKNNWVQNNYGIQLENYCVGKSDDKLVMLIAIANAFNWDRQTILLVDDDWNIVKSAASAGFQAATPMEVVNYITKS